MTAHTVSGGAQHAGDEFDCPFCRETLLEAFRAPAEAPPPRVSSPPGTPYPAVVPGADVRTVDLNPAHDMVILVVDGTWRTSCSCGWSRDGAYIRQDTAEILARSWADYHGKHPYERD